MAAGRRRHVIDPLMTLRCGMIFKISNSVTVKL